MWVWKQRSWTISWVQLALIALPFAVFLAINMLDWEWGHPSGYLAQPYGQDGHIELAARFRLFAGFLLFAGIEVAVLVYAAGTFRLLDPDSKVRLGIFYALLVVLGGSAVIAEGAHRGNRYVAQSFTCAALTHLHAPLAVPPAKVEGAADKTRPSPRPSEELAAAAKPPRAKWGRSGEAEPACAIDEVRDADVLLLIAAVLLILAMPAVVFATICCLAAPGRKQDDADGSGRAEAWAIQTRRLNNLLYLSAALMVSGLLFNAARLNWPAFSLHPDDAAAFSSHISGYLLYSSVGNSLLIASYYLPVAALLAASRPTGALTEGEAAAAAAGDDGDPFAALKTAATILAPVLLGLVGEVVKLLG